MTDVFGDGADRGDGEIDRPMAGRANEGDCPACGTTVRYFGYVPANYLCADCGGEKPHADGVVERDGRLFYEPEGDHAA